MWQCYYCQQKLSLEVQKKNRLCPSCGSDLHCCKNCTHFEETQSSQCKEPESPWVRDRAAQNTCPYFQFASNHVQAPPRPENTSESDRAKEAFKALFRNL